MLMVKLGKAGCHFAASGSRGGNDDKRTLCFDIIVFAIAFVADNQGDISGVALNRVMLIDLYAKRFQLLFIDDRALLSAELRQHDAPHIQPVAAECVNQPQYVHVVSDAQIAAHFIFLNIPCIDDNDDFRVLLQLLEHIDFAVRLVARQYPCRVVIVEQLAAEFQI